MDGCTCFLAADHPGHHHHHHFHQRTYISTYIRNFNELVYTRTKDRRVGWIVVMVTVKKIYMKM